MQDARRSFANSKNIAPSRRRMAVGESRHISGASSGGSRLILPQDGSVVAQTAAAKGSALYGQVPGSILGDDVGRLQRDGFDAERYIQTKCQEMPEKSIRKLCSELADCKRMSAEEMKKTMYANYKSFIGAAREIADLEGELRSIHILLSAQATLIKNLSDNPGITRHIQHQHQLQQQQKQQHLSFPSPFGNDDDGAPATQDPPEVASLMAIPEKLAVCLGERQIGEALRLLGEGEAELQRIKAGKAEGVSGRPVPPAKVEQFERLLQERRSELTSLLASITEQPSVLRSELREAVANLAKLGDPKRAHTLLLQSHRSRLRAALSVLRPVGVSYSGTYTMQISRLVFSTILQALEDSAKLFGDGPSHASPSSSSSSLPTSFKSELVLWAHGETEYCATLLQRYVLSAAAAAGGLRLAAECVQVAVGHCSTLEDRVGLALAPMLLRLVRPSVEQALEANIRRIEDSVAAMAAGDDWSMQSVPLAARSPSARLVAGTPVANFQLTSSAYRLYSMVQDFLEDVVPIVNMQLTTPTLDGLAHLFKQYVAMLNKARSPEEGDWEGAAVSMASSRSMAPIAAERSDGEEDDYDGRGGRRGEGDPSGSPFAAGGGAGGMGHVQRATTVKQQLALIANATVLAEELPRLAARLTQPVGAAGGSTAGMGKESFRFSREQRRSSGGESRRQQLASWKKGLLELVESLRMGFCLQKATELLFPDAHMEEQLLPNLYFLMDQIESDPALWFEMGPMPSEALQGFLRSVLALSDAASEVLKGRDRIVLQLLTQYGLALLTLVCHDKQWEDSHFFIGPNGLQQFLLDIAFLKEVAAKYHFTSRQLQQVADTSMERARESFDLNGECPGDGKFVELAQAAMVQILSSQAIPGRR